MSIEFEDRTTPAGEAKEEHVKKITVAVKRLLSAMKTASLGCYHSPEFVDLNGTDRVVALLIALKVARLNVMEAAQEEGIIIGEDEHGQLLFPMKAGEGE